jgi:hypothetical protein
VEQLDLDRLYSFSEAARLIPSVRGGSVSPKTLHRWRHEGRLLAVARPVRALVHWFVRGEEIARLAGQETRTQGPLRTAAAFDRAQAEAEGECRRFFGD